VALHAARVELCKAEVDGVYDVDPHTHGHARRFDRLTYEEALRLSRSGAKVLQEKAAALAGRWAIPVLVRPAFADGRGTTIGSQSEQIRVMPLPGEAVTTEAALGGDTELMSQILRTG
jgi:aspartate kinase